VKAPWRNRQYSKQGSYWPENGRYGVLAIAAFGGQNRRVVDFHVVDLAYCARVVGKFMAVGVHGSDRVQLARVKACALADELNALDREAEAA
jgi:hypothetical protein